LGRKYFKRYQHNLTKKEKMKEENYIYLRKKLVVIEIVIFVGIEENNESNYNYIAFRICFFLSFRITLFLFSLNFMFKSKKKEGNFSDLTLF